jgi:hypothetical protein
MILFPLFATPVVDTGANLQPVSLKPVANSSPVSTAPLEPVAKFAAGVVIPVVHLHLQISLRIFGKIRNYRKVIFGGLGDHGS